MKRKRKRFVVFFIPIVVILLLWVTGLVGLWTEGIGFIADNIEDFSDKKGNIVEGEYSLSIDLSNLESNIGKELYNDGIHRIYVSWIHNEGDLNSGGYEIGFRSSGIYSNSGASLISGVHHSRVDINSFTDFMTAKMTAEYNGKVYNSHESGYSGLTFKNGDEFSFYLFPTEAYETKEISLNETGMVYLTVTHLYKNIWSQK